MFFFITFVYKFKQKSFILQQIMQFAISTFNENKILLMKTKTICIASRAQEDNFEDTKDKTKLSKPSSFL